ncbi:anti-sigma factor family protein [Aureliella helgolandensis]|nr:hypothetical protein [Aureliella helgolandensis]
MSMPVDGPNRDELLSALVDDQLTPEELEEVNAALRSDAAAQGTLAAFRKNRAALGELAQRHSSGPLPEGFADRVVAAALQAKSQSDSEPNARSAATSVELPTMEAGPGSLRSIRSHKLWAMGLLAGAAAVVVFFSLPRPADQGQQLVHQPSAPSLPDQLTPSGIPNPAGLPGASATDATVRYVSDQRFEVLYALVVDIQITSDALAAGQFENTLAQAGIATSAPILMTPEVESAVENSKMIVASPTDSAADGLVYFVRAETKQIDLALQQVWQTPDYFPQVVYNIAMNNPQTRLLNRIAESTGKRFALNASFAASIADAEEPIVSNKQVLRGVRPPTKYVGAYERQQGWAAGGVLPSSDTEDMSTVLLILHPTH